MDVGPGGSGVPRLWVNYVFLDAGSESGMTGERPSRHSREKPALDIFNRGRESRVFAFSCIPLDAGSESGMTERGIQPSSTFEKPSGHPLDGKASNRSIRGPTEHEAMPYGFLTG